jgi:hypothetical protein
MSLQVQSISQTTPGNLKVTFAQAYAAPPVVLLTPYWKGSNSQVGGILTVTDITTAGCTLTSINAAANFYVNVLAIDSNVSQIGSLKANSGSPAKTLNVLKIDFNPVLSSPDPVVLLTSFWKGSAQSVGYIDTLDDSAASECSVMSSNQAATNYFTNFVAMDPGITATDNKQTLQNGIANKLGQTQRVYFTQPFSSPPIVMLSPWWNDANAQVGSIETLTNVTNYYFEFTSKNMAANYFVNWVAVGN